MRSHAAVLGLWLIATGVWAQDLGPLARGDSQVSGRVVDAQSGVPIAGAQVNLRVTAGASPANTVTTDGSGEYAFSGLAAGAYRLAAYRTGYVEAGGLSAMATQSVTLGNRQHVGELTLRLRRSVVISGEIVDEYGDPVDGISVFAQRIRYGSDGVATATTTSVLAERTDDLGRFRVFGLHPGDYLIAAAGRNARGDPGLAILPGPVAPADTVATYYPGTPHLADAQVVSLSDGEERTIQFALSHLRPVTVSGTALTSAGRPAAGMRVDLRTVAGQLLSVRGVGTTSAAGGFSIGSVSPGTYWILVSPPPGASFGERGAMQVQVATQDVTGLSITLNTGVALSGTVVFNSAFRPGTFQIQARPADARDTTAQGGISDPVAGDGGFLLRNASGKVFLTPANNLWMTTSVTVDGRELGEEPIDLRGQTSLSGLRVTVTDRLTDVSGSAVDDRGRPLFAHNVVFLRLDGLDTPLDWRVRVLKTDAKGQFHVRGLRPGNWVVGVVAELDPGYQFSPDFQEALAAKGRRFSLDPGQPLIFELGVTTGL